MAPGVNCRAFTLSCTPTLSGERVTLSRPSWAQLAILLPRLPRQEACAPQLIELKFVEMGQAVTWSGFGCHMGIVVPHIRDSNCRSPIIHTATLWDVVFVLEATLPSRWVWGLQRQLSITMQ